MRLYHRVPLTCHLLRFASWWGPTHPLNTVERPRPQGTLDFPPSSQEPPSLTVSQTLTKVGLLGSPGPSPTHCLISTHSRYSQHPTTRSLSHSDSLSQALPHTGTICRPRTVSHTTCHTRTHTQQHSRTHSQPHAITPSITACHSHRLLTIKITATNSRADMPGQWAGARDL